MEVPLYMLNIAHDFLCFPLSRSLFSFFEMILMTHDLNSDICSGTLPQLMHPDDSSSIKFKMHSMSDFLHF